MVTACGSCAWTIAGFHWRTIFDSFQAVARSISFRGAAKQFAGRMRQQHRAVAARAQAHHGQKDLLLSPAPGFRGVDVEGEHSSQSFANFSPT